MTPELFIASKASEAIKALYNADIEPSALQVSVTRKEFTGDFTLVVFPLLLARISSALFDGVLDAGVLKLVERIVLGTVIILFLIAEPNGLTAILDRATARIRAALRRS